MGFSDSWDSTGSQELKIWTGCKCFGSYGSCGSFILFREKVKNKISFSAYLQ